MKTENRKITIDDVAKALNISKTTVSRAISGKGRVGEKTRNMVMEYIKENNYKPNPIAKGLAESRTYNIAVVWPADYDYMDLPFFQRCVVGINKITSANDINHTDEEKEVLFPFDGEELTENVRVEAGHPVVLAGTGVKVICVKL